MNQIPYVALTAMLLAGMGSHAQGPAAGLKAGLNFSTLAVDDADDENSRVGFNAGVFGRTDPANPIGLQVELLYSTKGTHASYSGLFGLVDQDVDFELAYLELPVLAAFRLGEAFELQAGGYGAMLLSAHASTSGDLGDGEDELDKDHFTDMDFGLVGGAAFNAGMFQIGVRYLHGFTEVADSDASDLVLGDATNRCLQAFVGLGLAGER